MRAAIRLALLAAAFAVGTMAFGWIALVPIAVAWSWVALDRPRAARDAGIAALLAWSVLLAYGVIAGRAFDIASGIAEAAGVSFFSLAGITLTFAPLLTWSAARCGRAVALLTAARPGRGSGENTP